MTSDEFLRLWKDADASYEDVAGAVCVEEGDWVDDYKYQRRIIVYKMGEQYFCIVEIRSGSYFSDYDYHEPVCHEVEPKEVVKIEYVTKK